MPFWKRWRIFWFLWTAAWLALILLRPDYRIPMIEGRLKKRFSDGLLCETQLF